MPKRKERMAGYIRESDPSLADSTTIDSAAKAVRLYGQKEGYIYEPQHEYKEAISAYTVPYIMRKVRLPMVKRSLSKAFSAQPAYFAGEWQHALNLALTARSYPK